METFEQIITVAHNDLDELNHVNNVRYVQWINDVSKAHWYNKATPDMLNTYIWIVLKHEIHYKNAAFFNDRIKLKTYVILTKGVKSTRVVEMYNEDTNKLLMKSETNFCLLSKDSLKPTRIPEQIANLFN